MVRQIVIDACCTLNLLAMRREVAIAEALDVHFLDTPHVSRETLTLWTPPDADGERTKEAPSTAILRAKGRLQTRELTSNALIDAFVAAAARIKDPDASCIALAGVMALPLLTDDRKERRIARELFPEIELLTTLDVLAEAANVLCWSDTELGVVAQDLRWRGNFAPPRNDPRSEWYERILRTAGGHD